jgi:hypothetical protein
LERQVDLLDAKDKIRIRRQSFPCQSANPPPSIDHGDPTMTSPTSKLRARWKLYAALGVAAIIFLGAPRIANAQVVQGVEKGAREGNKAAGPVGGVLGGAIGGVVGVVTGVTGVLTG